MLWRAWSFKLLHLWEWTKKKFWKGLRVKFEGQVFKWCECCPIIVHLLKCSFGYFRTSINFGSSDLERFAYEEKLRTILLNGMRFPRVWMVACIPKPVIFWLLVENLERRFKWESRLRREIQDDLFQGNESFQSIANG